MNENYPRIFKQEKSEFERHFKQYSVKITKTWHGLYIAISCNGKEPTKIHTPVFGGDSNLIILDFDEGVQWVCDIIEYFEKEFAECSTGAKEAIKNDMAR